MRLILKGILATIIAFPASGAVFAQGSNLDEAMQICRTLQNKGGCQYLCYEHNIAEACSYINPRPNYNNNAALIGGIVSGIVSGAIANSRNRNRQQPVQQRVVQQPAQQPVQTAGQHSNEHYAYCMNRYKSYKVATNSYTSFSGQTRFCNSPYN
ncbi:MAG: BA14K family protein [Pseudomonadota bacterium]